MSGKYAESGEKYYPKTLSFCMLEMYVIELRFVAVWDARVWLGLVVLCTICVQLTTIDISRDGLATWSKLIIH